MDRLVLAGSALVLSAVLLVPNAFQSVAASPDSQELTVIKTPGGGNVTVGQKRGQQVVVLPFGYVPREAIWTTLSLAVCWENPTAATDAQRQRVKEAVESTWQKESKLRFTGWGACTPKARGIHIRIADEGPHVKALGRYLDARPDGMVLNFTFDKWSPACKSNIDFCTWALAVHEFGHAIAFAHEQNRPDAPPECQAERQGSNGNWNVTAYDPQSVMNYCNANWNNNGQLSARDIEAVRTIYGNPQP